MASNAFKCGTLRPLGANRRTGLAGALQRKSTSMRCLTSRGEWVDDCSLCWRCVLEANPIGGSVRRLKEAGVNRSNQRGADYRDNQGNQGNRHHDN